ncbi:hypothetical protein [Gordonia insulae]|nr:hypothetical protein [Gordonia insulae]
MVDRIERNKDLVQEVVESTATHVGRIATIITTAVADVAREVGDLFTDGFEMRDAARKARMDEQRGILDAELADPESEAEPSITAGAEALSAPAPTATTDEVEVEDTAEVGAAVTPDARDSERDVEDIPQPSVPVSPEVEAEIESEYDG